MTTTRLAMAVQLKHELGHTIHLLHRVDDGRGGGSHPDVSRLLQALRQHVKETQDSFHVFSGRGGPRRRTGGGHSVRWRN